MTDVNAAGDTAHDGIEVETNTSVPEPAPKVEKPVEPDADHEEGDEQNSDKKKNGWARQRDRLRAENQAKDRRIAELEAKINPKPAPQEPVDAPKGRPDIKDFTDVLEYVRADNEWLADQKIEAYKKSQKDEAEKTANDAAYKQKENAYTERADALLEKVPDFWERAQNLYTEGLVTPAIENAVLDSPVGEMVTLYLMANQNELAQMGQLNEAQTYRQIALIEAKITQSLSQSEQTVAAKKTNAAAPINPIGKKASTSTKSAEDMSQQEWDAYAAKLKPR